MAKNRSKSYKIDSGVKKTEAIVDSSKTKALDDKIAVNLRYYQSAYECFSEWKKDELKAFSAWVGKISTRTQEQITSVTATCHAHQGDKSKKLLPATISQDIKIYGLDVSASARIHGFFASQNFYIIWLDKSHNLHKKADRI